MRRRGQTQHTEGPCLKARSTKTKVAGNLKGWSRAMANRSAPILPSASCRCRCDQSQPPGHRLAAARRPPCLCLLGQVVQEEGDRSADRDQVAARWHHHLESHQGIYHRLEGMRKRGACVQVAGGSKRKETRSTPVRPCGRCRKRSRGAARERCPRSLPSCRLQGGRPARTPKKKPHPGEGAGHSQS